MRDRYLKATDRPGALQIVFTSSMGEVTLDRYIGSMCADTLVHTWDVARGAGVDDRLDPGAVRWVHAELATRDQSVVRKPGRYDEPLSVDGDDQTRLIAYTGRNPAWT